MYLQGYVIRSCKQLLISIHKYLSALTFTIATLTANYLKTILEYHYILCQEYFKYYTCLKWHSNEFMRKLKVKL